MQKIVTFLMFEGKAEEAVLFYTTIFKKAEIISITRYGANDPGAQGSVQHATFSLNGQEFMCIDSHVKHGFGFTPSMSLYVKCETEKEISELFEKLGEGGNILMPLAPYPFSEKFGWLTDKFGVTWQLNLQKDQATA